MRLIDLHLAVLPLPVHVVHYAELVADFDASTRALAEFVGPSGEIIMPMDAHIVTANKD